MVSIFVFSLIRSESVAIKLLIRIFLLPIIVSVSYEILKFSSLKKGFFYKLFVYPGVLLQKLTTREPDEKQIEVALYALKGILEDDIKRDN